MVELLVCLGILAILVGLCLPALAAAKGHARAVTCVANLHNIGAGLQLYAGEFRQYFPPFTLNTRSGPGDIARDIVTSGHWGGISQTSDPEYFVKSKLVSVNLCALQSRAYVSANALICPSAQLDLAAEGYFPFSAKFSTYGLRMPVSADLFRESPALPAYYPPAGMSVYMPWIGGQPISTPTVSGMAPLVRQDRVYQLDSHVAAGDFDPSVESVASDMFWRQAYSAVPAKSSFRVRWGWCHNNEFNVLYGGGAVRRVIDNSTIANNSNAPGRTLANDGYLYASYAEKVWQFFDAAR